MYIKNGRSILCNHENSEKTKKFSRTHGSTNREDLCSEKGRSAPYHKKSKAEKTRDQIPDRSVIKIFISRKQPIHGHHNKNRELAEQNLIKKNHAVCLIEFTSNPLFLKSIHTYHPVK